MGEQYTECKGLVVEIHLLLEVQKDNRKRMSTIFPRERVRLLRIKRGLWTKLNAAYQLQSVFLL